MAKLMARFDMQDRITKKIRTIRGEVEKLERARAKVNKPITLTMRAKDMATKILKKLHIYVLKDIAKTHTVTVRVKDKATKSLTAVSNFMKRRMPRTHALFVSVRDRAMPTLQRIGKFVDRNIARTQLMTILATDRAMPIIRRVGSFARSTLSRGYNFTVRGVDMASRIIGRVSTYVATAIPRVRTFTIRAINAASNVIGSVKNALFSIPTLITVTLAAVGLGKLKDATVGAAMRFEDYSVAMNHWLEGDTKAAGELMTWMGQKADKTPYSSPDIFPAMVGAVSLAGNNQAEIQRLTSAAIDMAALSGGTRTVDDAMQALIGARMGNLEMMKGFGMQLTKKDYDSMGWEGFIGHVEGVFEGGAEALSKTATGIISTLKGYRASIQRTLGDGLLGPMKPRLDAINEWLDNNQETWGRWKDVVERHGEEASEWLFSRLENSFNHIRSRYLDNKNFMDLDFEGKIKFIAEDIGAWWSSKGKPALNGWWESSGKPWAEKIGLFVGESIFNGILTGIKEGGKALGNMWLNAFKDPSLGSLGGAGVATLLAGALSSLVLSPLITAIGLLKKVVWDFPKKAIGMFGGKGPKTPKQPKQRKPNYRMPWTNRGEKPNLNTPNQKGGFKMPKGLSKGLGGLGKFVKGVPVIGTALGALSILTANKEDKVGAVGAVGGGIGGAALGAAVGSVIPGIGTAIGGIIGGIAGAMGGGALGDWLSDNWSSIKEGASATGQWISEKFSQAVTWTKETWSNVTGWFNETVWTPIAEGVDTAVNFIVGLWDVGEQAIKLVWGALSDWFTETVWMPITTTAGIAWDWISEKISLVWTGIQTIWGLAVSWFQETIWTPLMTAVGIVGTWIGDKFSEGWNAIVAIWGMATGWFEETVWSPITTAVGTLGTWIGDKFTEGWNAVVAIWGAASAYFEENIWGPIKTGAAAVEEAIKTPFKNAWEYVSGIFTKLGDTWDTIKDWGGKAASYVVERGKNRREGTPTYAQGTNFHPGGPAIVGDGGGPELIRYPSGNMSLSPGTDTMMNLPRGTEVLSHKKTIDFFNAVPAYADGVGFNGVNTQKDTLTQELIEAATRSGSGAGKSIGRRIRDIIIQITGDHHYSDEEDFDEFKKKVVEAVNEALDEEDFETGGLVIDG